MKTCETCGASSENCVTFKEHKAFDEVHSKCAEKKAEIEKRNRQYEERREVEEKQAEEAMESLADMMVKTGEFTHGQAKILLALFEVKL